MAKPVKVPTVLDPQHHEREIFHLKMLDGARARSKDTAIPAVGKGVVLTTTVLDFLTDKRLVGVHVPADAKKPALFWLTETGLAEVSRHP